jgi:hypothetical protein
MMKMYPVALKMKMLVPVERASANHRVASSRAMRTVLRRKVALAMRLGNVFLPGATKSHLV